MIFRVDNEGSNKMLNCLMYKMCYYRFGQVYTEGGESLVQDNSDRDCKLAILLVAESS